MKVPPRRDYQCSITWTLDLSQRTPFTYYMDGSRLEDEKVGCVCLLATKDGIVEEGQFRLTNESTMFAAETPAIKDAVRKGLDELNIFSDSRSALQALVPRRNVVAEIRDLVKSKGIKVHMHWIMAHVGYAYNESVDALGKKAAVHSMVDVKIPLPCCQMKSRLLGRALIDWQDRCHQSEDGQVTYAIFQRVSTRRLQGDFYVN